MRRFALMILLWPGLAGAEPWIALDGAGITDALTDRAVVYDNATQDFRASGRTLYTFGGRDSWGYWRVEGDRYCSQWPPSDLWACYAIEVRGDQVRFVGTGDDITEGTYAD